jgi:RNA polymerase sigma-70 factor, ECF subfamily
MIKPSRLDHSGAGVLERSWSMGAQAPTTTLEVADEGRLTSIVAEHFDLLWRFLHRLGVRSADVDDAVQEVIVVLARRLEQIEVGRERAFVLSTAYRVSSDFRRRVRRRREVDDSALIERESNERDPESWLAQKRLRGLLEHVLEQLPLELRAVFVLYELEELTMAEIATTLDLPPGTVASRLRRARETFERHAAAALQEREP